jgi:ketosteroid isomerase-like protein
MKRQTEAILGDIYDAFRAQDLDWLASYLPDDFTHVMHIPTDVSPGFGECRGKKPVIERWRMAIAEFDFLLVDSSGLIAEASRAAIEIHFRYRHRRTGLLLESTKANFWELEDGWPVRLTEYYDVGPIRAFTASLAAQVVS